ncbi:YIEGIA family protein [Aneurinibacillus migulanus]|uniref:Membrane protein n=1 Tax=Aneurinibacillus migulanus TaxID=47500 RepID=A0A0D1XI08_ANEMI|nr:YIEGIA family protein [Aneurinibacillus migulanus]KIV51893.1 membrane protein [Aneurinibacillus migulanus]KON98014.1 membrane protein [Aneurinibacillus migulanus]MED0891276.1 YIEGIA family protein [Aneurinibacillus migulanus]MED1614036.1 YIEGIA family protein [Aneurinibacillus migulanus]MED4728015.1 YIEGIA family protein [Aneurinibacillus migulanus]
MATYTIPVAVGVLLGVTARLYMLRTDYRQYPTYPHGRIIHIALGVIASLVGAVVIPSILKPDWTAVTFLGLAAQQFREVRNMERNMLQQLDSMELVPRGVSYIEGIAQVFEGRNYLVMFTSLVVTFVAIQTSLWWALVAGIIMFFINGRLMSGKLLGQIADIREGKIVINGSNLYVDDIYIMNVGLRADQDVIREHGVGVVITPKSPGSLITIANLGQRQAILHDVSSIHGVYRDSGEPALTPLAKRNMQSGQLGVFLLPEEKDKNKVLTTVKYVPVLDSAVRLPQEAKVNQRTKGAR